jgi:hypothetical protein
MQDAVGLVGAMVHRHAASQVIVAAFVDLQPDGGIEPLVLAYALRFEDITNLRPRN